jgi:protein involved in polysaccharide export with SLBB domain
MVVSKIFRVFSSTALLLAAVSCGRPLNAQVIPIPQLTPPANYRISLGDVLEVRVYQHPELSRRVVIKSDGNHILTVNGVRLPRMSKMDVLLRDLKIVNLSTSEVATLVRAKFESFIPNPQINVDLIEFVMQPSPINPSPSPLRDVPFPKSRQDAA